MLKFNDLDEVFAYLIKEFSLYREAQGFINSNHAINAAIAHVHCNRIFERLMIAEDEQVFLEFLDWSDSIKEIVKNDNKNES